MKKTNTILLIVLLLLLSAFVLTRMFRTPGLESSLDMRSFSVDTAAISSINFRLPEGEHLEYQLRRKGNSWTVALGETTSKARQFEIFTLLQSLNNVKPERVVTRKKDKWDDYEVSDSTGVQLTLLGKDDEKLAEWLVGRASQGLTYIRRSDDEVVYAVDGNIRSKVAKDFNHWRDRTFLKVNKEEISRLTFIYPADSGFVMEKGAHTWMIDGQEADSATVESYLRKIQTKDLTQFENGFVSTSEPDVTLIFEGSARPRVEVKGWKNSHDEWILTSSLQEGVYFHDTTFVKDLFLGKEWFLNEDGITDNE